MTHTYYARPGKQGGKSYCTVLYSPISCFKMVKMVMCASQNLSFGWGVFGHGKPTSGKLHQVMAISVTDTIERCKNLITWLPDLVSVTLSP